MKAIHIIFVLTIANVLCFATVHFAAPSVGFVHCKLHLLLIILTVLAQPIMESVGSETATETVTITKDVSLPPTPPETIIDGGEDGKISHDQTDADFPLPPPTSIPDKVLDIDKGTPDAHVPRDPRLIRLTGVHPFNVEAPLTDLFNEGFLTSPELFYVRNHGAVPAVKDEEIPDWEFSVEGYVLKSMIKFHALTIRIEW